MQTIIQIVIPIILGFVLANSLIIMYGTSTEEFEKHKINLFDIIKDGYKEHFVLIITMPVILLFAVFILNLPSDINVFFTIIPLLLDKGYRLLLGE